jgi:hypothetical protein
MIPMVQPPGEEPRRALTVTLMTKAYRRTLPPPSSRCWSSTIAIGD